MFRGFTRSTLWSSFSFPICGNVSSFDLPTPLQLAIGLERVANWLSQKGIVLFTISNLRGAREVSV
jgi:hypothetical protein